MGKKAAANYIKKDTEIKKTFAMLEEIKKKLGPKTS